MVEDTLPAEKIDDALPPSEVAHSRALLLPPERDTKKLVLPTPSVGYGSIETPQQLIEKQRHVLEKLGLTTTPAELFADLGYTAYKAVCFVESGDEYILSTTSLGDRVFVYFPHSRAKPLRSAGLMFPGISTDQPTDECNPASGRIKTLGASWLSWSAGHCATQLNIEESDIILGIMSAAAEDPGSSVGGDEVSPGVIISRYFAILYGGGEAPTFVFGYSDAAAVEFSSVAGEDGKNIFARATAVVPVLHSETLERVCSNPSGKRLASGSEQPMSVSEFDARVRECVFATERIYATAALAQIAESVERTYESVRRRILKIAETIPACVKTRQGGFGLENKETAVAMSSYAAKTEELIGRYWSELEVEQTAYKRATETLVADLYVETRISLAPDAAVPGATKLAPFARAASWGLSPNLDLLDFTDIAEGASTTPAVCDESHLTAVREVLTSVLDAAIVRATELRTK